MYAGSSILHFALDHRTILQLADDAVILAVDELAAQLVANLVLRGFIERYRAGVFALHDADNMDAVRQIHAAQSAASPNTDNP